MGDSLRRPANTCEALHWSGMEARRLRRLPRVVVDGHPVARARGLRARLLGLALLPRNRAGAGLLIPRCRSIHTFGMRFALDVFFLDADGAVLREVRGVRPLRMLRCSGAHAVLELPTAPRATRRGARSSV